jgi:pimeloyl-ACP methyl ester carboxylesterase
VAELAATGVPVLVAHGEADDAWLPSVQADMARRLGARHEVIDGSIHSPAVENPPRTVAVLLDFWASVAGGNR